MSDPKQETLQQRIRRECIQQVGNDFLQSLYTKGPGNFLVTVSHLWAGVLLAFLVGMWALQLSTAVFMWIYLPLALFIATRINGLNVQVHEGSHGLLSESRLANDLLCNWMAAYPTLYDVDQ